METTQPRENSGNHPDRATSGKRSRRRGRTAPPGNRGAAPTAPGGPYRPGRPRVSISSPADVLAVVPYLLGFHPDHSFVVVGAGGRREQVELTFRYELPDPPDAAMAAEIARHAAAMVGQHAVTTVIGVGYGPGHLVTPVADAFAAAVRDQGLHLRELMRVADGHYWSYLCENVNCCPADGVPFDTGSHPAAAVMTAAGFSAHTDRESLARTIAPLTGQAARDFDEALDRACQHAAAIAAGSDPGQGRPAGGALAAGKPGSLRALRPVIQDGRRAVRDAVAVYRAGGRITDDDAFAWLLVTLAILPVRDDAWARMLPEHADAHLAMWTDLVRRARGTWLPAPATLLAFTAWQTGNGALANMAIDLALAEDPRYSLALLLRDILEAGIPPSAARLPMTPRQVAHSYRRETGER